MRALYASLALIALAAVQACPQSSPNAGTGSFGPPVVSSANNSALDHFAPGAIESPAPARTYKNKFHSLAADPDPRIDCPLKREWALPY